MSLVPGARFALRCDCCGTETVGEVVDGKLVIKARRHGKTHIFSEQLDRLLASVEKGTTSKGAIRVAEQKKPQP